MNFRAVSRHLINSTHRTQTVYVPVAHFKKQLPLFRHALDR